MEELGFKLTFNLKAYVHNHNTVKTQLGRIEKREQGCCLWGLVLSSSQGGRMMTKFSPLCCTEERIEAWDP